MVRRLRENHHRPNAIALVEPACHIESFLDFEYTVCPCREPRVARALPSDTPMQAILEILDLRIRQLHEAMGRARTSDFSAVQPRVGVAGETCYASVDFSDDVSDAGLANIISQCVENIARLKDHLKAWCKEHSKPFQGERLIDNNRNVGVIHDLWNREKHFDPKPGRTGLSPEIRNISRGARLTTQVQAGSRIAMTLDPITGQMKTHGDGKAELVVDADVVDANGARIGGLLEIAEQAVAAWEGALTAAGVVVPPR